LFDFHSNNKLLENYTRLEILALVLSYIGLSFLVGCSSTIALKEYSDKYYDVYFKNVYKNKVKGEKFIFFVFSCLSIFVIMQINRKIFISFEEKTSKWMLMWIIISCFASFLSSMIFYGLYSIPITSKEKTTKNASLNNKEEKKKENEDKNNPEENIIGNKKKNKKHKAQKINVVKTENEDKNYVNTEMAVIKINQSSPDNKEQKKKPETEYKINKEIYTTKVFTLCGYLYFRKTNIEKSSCICYYYTSKCNWFKNIVCDEDIIIPTIIEFYCQICIMGFKLILAERLLNDYSYIKNLKFYITLLIFSLFFGFLIVYKCKMEVKKKYSNDDCSSKIDFLLQVTFVFLFGFIIFNFFSSIFYYTDKRINRERWNNVIMANFIFFKIIDFQILTVFNFYDNSDMFNTTLAITLEKLLWMIIETIIDTCVKNKKKLVLVQLIVSAPIAALLILIMICGIVFACVNDDKDGNKNANKIENKNDGEIDIKNDDKYEQE